MIAIPAVDIREGNCVQLVGGSYDSEAVRLDDPPAVARRWEQAGFQRLHIVDLDAATRRGENSEMVRDVLRSTSLDTQVGGGVRDSDRIETLLRDGAQRVVVGTRAIESMDWLEDMARTYPDTLIVAADVRDRIIVTHGWEKKTDIKILDYIGEVNGLALAGVMVTAVHKEGKMDGTDIPLMEAVAHECTHPVYASGGVGTLGDLRALEDCGVAAAVLGMALYTGALDARVVAEEFFE